MISKLIKNAFMSKSTAFVGQRFFGGCHSFAPEDSNDATTKLLDSVNSTLKGISHVNYIVEHEELTDEAKAGKKRFLIYKYDPTVMAQSLLNNKKLDSNLDEEELWNFGFNKINIL